MYSMASLKFVYVPMMDGDEFAVDMVTGRKLKTGLTRGIWKQFHMIVSIP